LAQSSGEECKEIQCCNKLVKTLKATLLRIKKSKEKAQLKKITITFPNEVSNEYFNPGAPEKVLTMLPYVFEHTTTSKKSGKAVKFKSTEAVLAFRVFVMNSDEDIEEDVQADDDVMDQIGDLLGNI
jgi:hypothetical protein